jgi:hypothetical protein
VTITGTFTATLQAELPRGGSGAGIFGRIRDAVRGR